MTGEGRSADPLPKPNPVASCRSSIPKLSRIFWVGYVYMNTRWGDVEWGVVVGFLDRIAQPNERLESGMRGEEQCIKWSQSVSRLKTI